MDADRMVTIVCAKRDFGAAGSAEVFRRFAKDPLVMAFRERSLDAELAAHNLLNRHAEWRGLKSSAAPKPGLGKIGKLTIEGRRGYLWQDDGSFYGESVATVPATVSD